MVKVVAHNPQSLLEDIENAIADEEITTWEKTSGGSLTHTNEKWRNKAWFRPKVNADSIIFNIIRPKGGNVSKDAYAIYHGRFSSMLLTHFDNKVKTIEITALASNGDIV
ncbi:MAG: hypothetical protein ABSF28_26835 [Terracidiphilus sp.]|jgi:hypothetical protein